MQEAGVAESYGSRGLAALEHLLMLRIIPMLPIILISPSMQGARCCRAPQDPLVL